MEELAQHLKMMGIGKSLDGFEIQVGDQSTTYNNGIIKLYTFNGDARRFYRRESINISPVNFPEDMELTRAIIGAFKYDTEMEISIRSPSEEMLYALTDFSINKIAITKAILPKCVLNTKISCNILHCATPTGAFSISNISDYFDPVIAVVGEGQIIDGNCAILLLDPIEDVAAKYPGRLVLHWVRYDSYVTIHNPFSNELPTFIRVDDMINFCRDIAKN